MEKGKEQNDTVEIAEVWPLLVFTLIDPSWARFDAMPPRTGSIICSALLSSEEQLRRYSM